MKRIVAFLLLCIGGAAVIFMIPRWLDRIHRELETPSRPAKSFRRDLSNVVQVLSASRDPELKVLGPFA